MSCEHYDGTRAGRRRRVHQDPGHRADAPVPVVLVAARARARLRARLHPPGDRSRPGHRRRRHRAADVRRRPARAAGAGRGRGKFGDDSRWQSIRPTADNRDLRLDARSTGPMAGDRSRPCSPASGPTCRSRRWPGWPPAGATRAWRSPAGVTISMSGGGGGRRLHRRPAGDPRPVRAVGLRHLQPPEGSGGVRRPDRRPAPRHPARPDLGRRRPRGRPAAGRRGHEDDRPHGGRDSASTPSSASPGRRCGSTSRCSRPPPRS